MGIRFIKAKSEGGGQKNQDGGVGSSSNWPGRVFTQVMIATAKEFPPSFGARASPPMRQRPQGSSATATPRTRTTTFTMGGGGKIPYEKSANPCQCRVDVD